MINTFLDERQQQLKVERDKMREAEIRQETYNDLFAAQGGISDFHLN